ncbi:MAG TPA: indole-3-glycerol phosphate synthase TrpC [Actinomycetota bacterium]|nr:indole-3-glycerol phosphate synthase TrpC [Actinomycetota bacterium]
MGFLSEMVERVRRDLRDRPLAEGSLLLRTRVAAPAMDFEAAIRSPGLSLIAEVKRASPSAGDIADVDAGDQAAAYESAGAAAVSVLTEPRHFNGSLADLRSVRRRTALPILRKDFLIHPGQVIESRANGADAVLLIAAALSPAELEELRAAAEELGMAALVEVHAPPDLESALAADARIIGVNARDLETLEVDPEAALQLAASVPADRALVVESGLRTRDQVQRAAAAGADAVLVGEALMRAGDPTAAIRELLGR